MAQNTPTVPVQFGGKTYMLRYGYGAFERLQTTTGKTFHEALSDIGNDITILKHLLYAGLMTNYRNVTLEEAGELLDQCDISDFVAAFGKAMGGSEKNEPDPQT